MSDYVDWRVTATTIYRYWFLPDSSNASCIKAEAGNYAFVKHMPNGWVLLYVGIAENLSKRIPNHERWAEAKRLGATHVMAHTNPNRAQREAEEKALIGHYDPPLNTEHRLRA